MTSTEPIGIPPSARLNFASSIAASKNGSVIVPLSNLEFDHNRSFAKTAAHPSGRVRAYSEGIDNHNDGRLNEDGVGGLDINRNRPSDWQQEFIQNGAGPYPLSEPETRAVAEFLLAHRNVVGLVNHHMAEHFLPPDAPHVR